MRSLAMLLMVAFLAISSCRGDKRSPAAEQTAENRPDDARASSPLAAEPPAGLPALADLPRTSDPDAAFAGLDTRITTAEKRLGAQPDPTVIYPDLIAMLSTRAQFLAEPDDYGRALELAGAYVAAQPKNKRSYLVRARTRAALHRFDDAVADLDKASQLGAHPSATQDSRIAIALALGDLDRALELAEPFARDLPRSGNFVMLAMIHDAMGNVAKAEDGFRDALAALRSASPLELSWLLFQWGRLYEKTGQLARARYLYEIAHARLPRYAAAASHLASVLAASGDKERAHAMLTRLMTRSNNPEYVGLLAGIERDLGNTERAAELAAQATAGFDKLIARFPAAFGDHAARHFLESGNDPTRAFELARQDLARRQTSESYTLAIEAGLAAGAREEACDLAEPVAAMKYAAKPALFQAWRAFGACDRRELRTRLAARLGIETPSRP